MTSTLNKKIEVSITSEKSFIGWGWAVGEKNERTAEKRRHDTQHNYIQYNDIQYNDIKYNDI